MPPPILLAAEKLPAAPNPAMSLPWSLNDPSPAFEYSDDIRSEYMAVSAAANGSALESLEEPPSERFLHVWFTVGVAFSFMALLGVSVMLLWGSAGPFHLQSREMGINSLSVPGLSLSIMDVGIMIVSTLMSVALHEFGHAVAAARTLGRKLSTSFILQVMGVPQTSALSGYLSPYDVIISLDGSNIKSPQEWINKMAKINAKVLPKFTDLEEPVHSRAVRVRKGYCIPNSWVENSRNDQFSCPDELTAFVSISCFNSSLLVSSIHGDDDKNKVEHGHCLTAQDVVKLKKCGDEWEITGDDRSHCACSEV
ncbi:hypothetical protein COCNU_14G001590 [Cocos nucifera]|uniref:Endopeptidase S2P n=1 Tax=Cocos nucifera TaxID=13894 RepID=A0A8K0NBD0_COCNU|nr:hypothetical protein COCNU_14G001590 [Cocos nucifera]